MLPAIARFEILRRLLDGEEVSFAGEHYRLAGVRTKRALQSRLPFMVAVNGQAALAHGLSMPDIRAGMRRVAFHRGEQLVKVLVRHVRPHDEHHFVNTLR